MDNEIKTTDAAELSVTEEAHIVKTEELPKSWTDDQKAIYRVVRNYFESTGNLDAQFPNVPSKVVTRARRDAK